MRFYIIFILVSLSYTFQEVKHKILFLLEMLEPFLVPAMCPVKGGIIFGDTTFTKKEEENCAIALDIIRIAVEKPAVLPSLETEWRHGSVSPRYDLHQTWHFLVGYQIFLFPKLAGNQ